MQYFYLICTNFDETTCPRKVFLQEHQAITWGRRLATKLAEDEFYANFDVALYKQEITRSGELRFVKNLAPYKNCLGSDHDIDIRRPGDPGIDTTFG